MTRTTMCASEKAAWNKAGKEFRANEGVIGTLDQEIASAIGLMRSAGRPLAELDWAAAIAQASSGAEARSAYHQRMALTFELRGNTQASRVCSMAARRGDAVERRTKLESAQAAAEQAYRECVERLVLISQQRCGQPRTGHGHEGEPCQIPLGADGACQYHGAAMA